MQTQTDQSTVPARLLEQLATCRRQLEAAQRKNQKLLMQQSVLSQELSSLKIELSKSSHFAYHDELTGLPNRRLLYDRFDQASALAKRQRQAPGRSGQMSAQLALLLFDVDDFKDVNDELGHVAGDQLLQQVATRLSSSIRQSDTACRFGGDEFMVLLTDLDDRQHAIKALKKIRDCLAPPYLIGDHSIRLTISNGMATFPGEAECFMDLVRLSDSAMYSKKNSSQNRPDAVDKSNIWLQDAATAP